jgi:hypothetical protein
MQEPGDTAERLQATIQELRSLRDENFMLRMLISQQQDILRYLDSPSLLQPLMQ